MQTVFNNTKHFEIDAELIDKLESYSDEHDISKDEVLETAIRFYLNYDGRKKQFSIEI